MKCEECLPSIDDYVEEELDLQDAGPLAAHLASCQTCSGVYEESIHERQVYARYRRQIAVPPSMWDAVHARIADQKAPASSRPQLQELAHAARFVSAPFRTRYAAAAILALFCACALIGYYALVNSHKQAPELMSVQSGPTAPAPITKPSEMSDIHGAHSTAPNNAVNSSPGERRELASSSEFAAAAGALIATAKNKTAAEQPQHNLAQQLIHVKEDTVLTPGASTPFDVALPPREPQQITLPVAHSFHPASEAYLNALQRAARQFEVAPRVRKSGSLPIIDTMYAPKAGGEAEFKLAKFEVGGHVSSLSLGRGNTSPGVGSRFTYNVNNFLALETEGNVFPGLSIGNNGRKYLAAAQGLFGIKLGKRWKKIGVFAKFRPGFMGFRSKSQVADARSADAARAALATSEFETKTVVHPMVDVGGVVEIYSSRRIVTRFDFGDAIVYNRGSVPNISSGAEGARPGAYTGLPKHNFQLGTGISLRF